ncbi:choice-of-anchor D domain-containing protein [Parahalioglobus pacificus]|nr:choice-of-anchor D domain-containing protein [Halioglobus pacificus]
MNRVLTAIVVALGFALGGLAMPAQAIDCPANNYSLGSQTDVDNFPAGCDTVTGRLRIEHDGSDPGVDPVVNLAPLAGLLTITGDLSVRNTPELRNLSGLEGVTAIGGNLQITANAQLRNTVALNGASVGAYVRVETNPQLRSLNLASVGPNLNGYLRIRDNRRLNSIADLSGIETVTGYVFIFNNDRLLMLAGLNDLNSITEYLTLQNNNRLNDITALSNLSTLGGNLRVRNNDDLLSLNGLNGLNAINGFLEVRDNNELTDLSALGDIATVSDRLTIRNNDALLTLAGLESITAVNSNIEIRDNLLLNDISALNGLPTAGRNLEIRNNDGLASLAGLDNLTRVNRDLTIRDNDALLDVSSLAKLARIERRLFIQSNAALTNLNGMGSLVRVGNSAIVRRNDNLADCRALIPLLDATDDADSGPSAAPVPDVNNGVTVNNNAVGCESSSAILASAAAPEFTQEFTPALTSITGTTIGSQLRFDISNNNPSRITGVALSNTLPAGIALASPAGASTSCAGSLSTSGSDTLTLGAFALAANSNCTVTVDVVGTADGSFANDTDLNYITSDASASSVISSATLTVDDEAPVITIPGANPLELFQGDSFSDPAVSANDTIDGSVSVTRSGTIDTSVLGSYTRSYTATDAVGNSTTESLTVNVIAVPVPGISLSPSSLDFGGVRVGSSSDSQSVSVQNTGTAALNVSAISGLSAPFSITGGSCSGGAFALPAGDSCTLDIDFSPTAAGGAVATLTVSSDAPTGDASVGVSGTGTEPVLTLSTNAVDFGEITIGASSPAGLVTLSNSGSADLSVSAIADPAAPFSRSGGSCAAAGMTLAPGESCSLEYVFTPTAAGAVDASITLTSDSASGATSIALTGEGRDLFRSFAGTLPSGGAGNISFTTTDPSCEFASDPQFIPARNYSPAPPANLVFVDGIVIFEVEKCAIGATIDVTVDYGAPLDPSTQNWKTLSDTWQPFPALVSGNSMVFSLTDGASNDEDGTANGRIVDPSGAVLPAAPTAAPPSTSSAPAANTPVPVPVNAPLILLMLAAGLAMLARNQPALRKR